MFPSSLRKTPSALGSLFSSLFLVSIFIFKPVVGHCQTARLKADDLFQTHSLLEIEIQMPEKDWSELTAQTRDFGSAFQNPAEKPFTSFKGTITVNGVRIESVGIRKKGFIGSLDDYRPSLKIKFDEYVDQDPIEGLDRLTLNNNKQDVSLVSQFLTYRTFRKAGLAAPRMGFARVTVNGEFLGIYSNIEAVRKPFLKEAFGKSSGNLYEGTLSDLYPKAINRIEVKKGKSDAIDTLLPLAELLAAEGDLDLAKINKMVDVPNFLKFVAIETLIGFWDGYANNQNNYFIYQNPENGKYYFIPWGADGAFDSGQGFMRQMANINGTAIYANGMLANRLFWAGDTKEKYVEIVQSLMDQVWKEEELIAEIDRVVKLVSSDLHKIQSDYGESFNQVKTFIRGRRAQMNGILASGWDNVPKTPRKPMYSVPVGHAEGTFSSVWKEENGGPVDGTGKVELTLVLDEKTIEFTSMTAVVGPLQFRGFGGGFGRRGGRGGGPGGRGRGGPSPEGGNDEPPPASIALSGVRKSDGQSVTLSLIVARENLIAGLGTELDVTGTLQEGNAGGGFGRPGGMRSISGKLKLDAAGVKSGDAVAGSVDLEIVETRGGMFSRR